MKGARVLIVLAAAAQVALYVATTAERYWNQSLVPSWFDFTRTANVLAALYTLAMLVTLARLWRREIARAGLATVLGASAAALMLILLARSFGWHGEERVYAGAALFDLLALGTATALAARDRRHPAVRTAQHTLIVAAFVFGGTLLYGLFTPTDVPVEERADAAVILGAAVWSHNRPSPALRLRILKAQALLRSRVISTIVCTGSNALGERSEAATERLELIRLGVDSTAILTETRSNSTLAQIVYVRDSLVPRGFRSFVIVSDHYHLRRALEMCAFNGLRARGAASESLEPVALLSWYRLRDSAALILYWLFGV